MNPGRFALVLVAILAGCAEPAEPVATSPAPAPASICSPMTASGGYRHVLGSSDEFTNRVATDLEFVELVAGAAPTRGTPTITLLARDKEVEPTSGSGTMEDPYRRLVPTPSRGYYGARIASEDVLSEGTFRFMVIDQVVGGGAYVCGGVWDDK